MRILVLRRHLGAALLALSTLMACSDLPDEKATSAASDNADGAAGDGSPAARNPARGEEDGSEAGDGGDPAADQGNDPEAGDGDDLDTDEGTDPAGDGSDPAAGERTDAKAGDDPDAGTIDDPEVDDPGPGDAGVPMVDPCEALACGEHQRCVEGDAGDLACACDPGYREDGDACVRDECVPLMPGAVGPCGEFGICVDSDPQETGDVTCTCEPGYRRVGDACVRDECQVLTDGDVAPCAPFGVCSDPDPAQTGEVSCTCDPGYRQAGSACVRDECVPLASDDKSPCGPHGTCADDDPEVTGTPECTCDAGYQLDPVGWQCVPNECELSAPSGSICGSHADCADDGNYGNNDFICTCRPDFDRCDPGYATPQDECDIDLRSDADHCGACGNACAGDLACTGGTCEQAAARLVGGSSSMCAAVDTPDGAGLSRFRCWGNNAAGQINQAPQAPGAYYSPTAPGADPRLRDIALGSTHSCGILEQDRVLCWGDNRHKQLGVEASTASLGQVSAPGARDVEVADGATCVLYDNNRVRCWGRVLGGTSASPTHIPLDGQATSLDGAGAGFCAVMESGRVSCWMSNHLPVSYGLGDAVQVEVAGLGAYTRVAVRFSDGDVSSWAAGDHGRNDDLFAPQGETVIDLAAGPAHLCVATASGQVYCAGQARALAVIGSDTDFSTWRPVPGLDNALDVEVTAFATCSRRASGQVVCWGANDDGQLGTGYGQVSDRLENVVSLP